MQEAGDKGFCGGQLCPWVHLELQIPPLFRTASVLYVSGSRLGEKKKENQRERKRKGKSILVAVARYCSALVLVQMEALVAF